MEGWIFKRTALRFAAWIGAILLPILGIGLGAGCLMAHNAALSVIGVVIFLVGIVGGIFLAMYAKSLNKWIEIKKQ